MMTSPITTSTTTDDVLMSGGVSRSGRVRKKSSKLLDFQSPDDVEKKYIKRSTIKGQNRRGRRPRSTAHELEYLSQNDHDDDDDDYDDNVNSIVGHDQHDVNLDDNLPDLSDLGSLNHSPADLTLDVKLLDGTANVSGVGGCGGVDSTNAMVSNQALLDNLLSGAPDSEDELDNLVADLVEGVQAECLEQSNKNLIDNKTVRQSLYMTEKSSNKRKMLTGKIERKDKGKSRFTAYNLWSRDFRQSSKFAGYQDLDFSSTARRLGELWANVSVKEKAIWRRKAKQRALKARDMENNSKTDTQSSSAETTPIKMNAIGGGAHNNSNNNVFSTSFLNRATTSRTKKLAEAAAAAAAAAATAAAVAANNKTQSKQNMKNNNNNSNNNNNNESKTIIIDSANNTKRRRNNSSHKLNASQANRQDVDHQIYAVEKSNNNNNNNNNVIKQNNSACSSGFGINSIDAAAHLKLLGESLSIIGKRLKEHDGQIAVSGSLSVLLDSLLCSMGPLLCLTTHLPGLENEIHLQKNLTNILDNIAYVMPGL